MTVSIVACLAAGGGQVACLSNRLRHHCNGVGSAMALLDACHLLRREDLEAAKRKSEDGRRKARGGSRKFACSKMDGEGRRRRFDVEQRGVA